MTPQKAIANIDEVLNSTLNYDDTLDYQLTTDDCDWLEAAKSVLEKQIPKKPTAHKVDIPKIKVGNGFFEKGTTVYRCPCCNELISRICDCCYKCGQALDWSEVKKRNLEKRQEK